MRALLLGGLLLFGVHLKHRVGENVDNELRKACRTDVVLLAELAVAGELSANVHVRLQRS